MDFDVDLSGLERVLRDQPGAMRRAGDMASEAMIGDMKLSMGTSPPGRSYKRRSRVHIASQPGYPPNVDTGALRASLKWERSGPGEWTLSDGVEYGQYLELQKNRPFISPVFVAYRNKLAGIVRKALGLV